VAVCVPAWCAVPGAALCLALASGCADRARAPAPPATSSAAPAPAAVTDGRIPLEAELRKRGYRAVSINGTRVYCRSEAVTGTSFRSTVCLSAAQIQAEQEQTRASVDTIERVHPIDCGGQQGKCSSQ
jgi:hypothetical protein